MNRGIYPPLAGAISLERRLDVVAHNIGNIHTTGYKKDKPVFETILGRVGGIPEAGIDLFPRVGTIVPETTQGTLHHTGRPLDVALDGEGFLVVNTPSGPKHYRGGALHQNEKGELVTHEGDHVLGVAGPITIPKGDVSIDAAGNVHVNNTQVGQLRIERLPAEATPEKVGDLYWKIPAKVQAAPNTQVRQGMLEKSNINPALDMVELIKVTRAYEQMQKAIQTMDEMAKNVIQVARTQG